MAPRFASAELLRRPHSDGAGHPGATDSESAPPEQSPSIAPRLTVSLLCLCSVAFFGVDAVTGEFLRGWDAPTHLFMASSYLNDWWGVWDARWFGGYAEVSYPPLVHQLIAAISLVTGDLTRAYVLVALAFLAVGPYAAFRF